MKHIPLLSKEEADPELRKKWDAFGFDLALFHVWAHVPDAFMAYTAFNGTVWRDEPDGFPLLQKEMAVVHASVLSNSSYEWGNHGASMLRRGGTQEQLDALVARQPDSDVFDETEKLILRFTTEVTLDGKASEENLTAMAELYTHKQVSQLVFAICAYMLNSRFANLGGCEKGDDEDFGNFMLGRKTTD
ncbi:MAG: carboxymuconolactone decarboxylase family protein [Proteobacteria bacterium]|jgi:alkylhydroperoxidase family enzyme|nr:carboxymuconolactone decarboxylase family protein [Pseudomonadota bacterium]